MFHLKCLTSINLFIHHYFKLKVQDLLKIWPLTSIGSQNGTPLQYSCLENPMDGGAWWAAVHGIAEGRTRLSDFTFTFHFHALEKEMATHSSVLGWRIPGTGEPGGLLSMGSDGVGHNWSDLAAAAAAAVFHDNPVSRFQILCGHLTVVLAYTIEERVER